MISRLLLTCVVGGGIAGRSIAADETGRASPEPVSIVVPAEIQPAASPLAGASGDHVEAMPYWYWYPGFYRFHTAQHGAVGLHHGRAWKYMDSRNHGFPYGVTSYLPRYVGASHTFAKWVPTRSFYYPYIPGDPHAPYGFSPEPYYGQSDLPAGAVKPHGLLRRKVKTGQDCCQ